MGRILAVLALVALLVAVAAPCWSWSTATNISNRSDYACNPRVAKDSSNNLHCVWFGGPSGSWQVYYQKYNGTSWSAPVAISSTGASFPAVAVDGSNNVHVVWHQGSNPEEIYYRKCTGGTWGSIVNISNTSNRSLYPRIAAQSNGDVLVVWHEDQQTGGNYDIVAKKCTGGSWGILENASNDSNLSRNPDVAVDSNNNYHICWEDLTNSSINYIQRTSAGSYTGRTRLDSDSAYNYYSEICVSPNNNVHVAWHDNGPGNYEIYYRYFNGSTWSGITNVSNQSGVTDCYCHLAADSNNDIHVAWSDYHTIYYAHQRSGSWRPVTTVYTNNSKYPVVCFTGSNRAHLLWMDNNTGWNTMWSWQDPDTTAPANVTNFTAYGTNGQVQLNWTNPSAGDFVGTMIRYKTTGYPTSISDGTLLCDRHTSPGSADAYTHTGVTNGTTYYYTAFAYDAEPNYASGAQVSGTPVAPPKTNLLTNGAISTFTSGVATGWTAYRVNDPSNAITFASDTSNFTSSPSQAANGIDGATLPASGLTAAGIVQAVGGLTVGKVYQLVGMVDLYNSGFTAAGHRYLLNFGVNPSGGTTPGTPDTSGNIGGCKWMTPSQALWNDTSGGSAVSYSGFHRASSAFQATGTSVSAWAGVTLDNAAAKDATATKFNADDMYLFEWDLPANAGLQNGNFESSKIDLQDGGDIIPSSWVPAGGGCGQTNGWYCDSYGARSGSNGARLQNRRGVANFGLMQRIACNSGYTQTFTAYAMASNQDSTIAAIGIDPYGGGDITSANIEWQSTTSGSWTQLTATATSQSTAITVFLKTSNTNGAAGNYHWSYFDDATYSQGGASGVGSISGTVTASGGGAIAGATVSTDVGGYSTTTDSNGNYTLTNVTAGTYAVTASKATYYSQTNTGVVVTIGNNTVTNFSLVTIPGTISGTVKDSSGNNISGATVSTNVGGYTTTSAANGSYTLSNVTPGTYSVTASKTDYNPQTNSGVVVTSGNTTTTNFNLVPQPGTISGSVKDNAGYNLANATVSTTTGGYTTTSASDGSYTLSSVAPGTYSVTGSKTNYNSQTNTGVAVTSNNTTTSNFNLVPLPGSIIGTVRDAAGTALSGANVSTTTGGYSTTSASDGSYTLASVTPATYTVVASKTNYNSQTNSGVVVNPNQATTSDFNLVPQPGTISGSVKNTNNVGISGATVSTTTGGYTATTDSSGNYTISNVAVGTYTINCSKTGYNTATNTGVVVTSNQTTTSNFTLVTSGTEKVRYGDMEGGFFSTGWASTCGGHTSQLPGASGSDWGWNNDGTYPFNTWDATSIKHGGSHALGFCFCQTSGSPGKMGIVFQNVNLGAANASATFSAWGYETDGNCPTIMCWNPGQNQSNPLTAYNNGRYQWIIVDNWGQRNTWVNNTMTVTADSTGYVTIMVGGTAWTGTANAAPLYIDDVSVK